MHIRKLPTIKEENIIMKYDLLDAKSLNEDKSKEKDLLLEKDNLEWDINSRL